MIRSLLRRFGLALVLLLALSARARAQTLPPPTGVTATLVDAMAFQVRLRWQNSIPCTAGDNTSFVRILTSIDGGPFFPFIDADCVTPSTLLFLDTDGSYRFEVEMHDIFEDFSVPSAPTAPLTVKVPRPSLSGSVQNNLPVLTWPLNNDASSFEIICTEGGVQRGDFFVSNFPTTSFTVTTDCVNRGSTYVFKLRTFNFCCASDFSSTVTLKIPGPLAAPTGVKAQAVAGTTDVNVSWTAVTGASGYQVFFSRHGANSFTLGCGVNSPSTSCRVFDLNQRTTFDFDVMAFNNVEDSPFSAIASATTDGIPPQPSGVTAAVVAGTRTSVKVSWNAVAGASFYRVWSDFDIIQCSTSSGTTTSCTFTLDAPGSHAISVQTVNQVGESGFNQSVPVTIAAPPPMVPVAPTAFTAKATSPNTVDLAWTDTQNKNLTGYEIRRFPGSSTTSDAVINPLASARATTDFQAVEGTKYTYKIRAENLDGKSPSVSATVTTPLAAPTNLGAAIASVSTATLTWKRNSTHETLFHIEQSVNGGAFAALGTTAPAGATSFTVGSLVHNTRYRFRVRAENAVATSAFSNEFELLFKVPPPTTPTALTAQVASATSVKIGWQPTSSNASTFRVEASANGGAFKATTPATAAGTATTLTVTGLTTGTTYDFHVRAENGGGNSGFSTPVRVLLAKPPAPTGLAATIVDRTRIDLRWSADLRSNPALKVERLDPGKAFAAIPCLGVPAPTTSCSDTTSLVVGSTYQYRVTASNGAGSATSATVTVIFALPDAPTALTARALSRAAIGLSWQSSSPGVTRFRVFRTPAFTTGAFVEVTTAAFTDTGVSATLSYTYVVQAVNAVGASPDSAPASASPNVPPAPTGLTASLASGTQIDLRWTDRGNNEGFRVESSPDGKSFQTLSTVGAGVTTLGTTAIKAPGTYVFRVFATNAVGDSGPSVPAQLAVQVPADPSGLAATVASATQVNLAWADNSLTEAGFIVERGTSGTNIAKVGTTARNVATFNGTGLTASTTYFHRVKAFNLVGASFYTEIVSASTAAPAAPTLLTATVVSGTEVRLDWQDNASNESEYHVEQMLPPATTFTDVGVVLKPNTVTFSVKGLTAGAKPSYRVYARNGVGKSGFSNVAATTLAKPSAPSTLTAEAQSGSAIKLTWKSASANETGFRIERSPSATTGFQEINVVGPAVTTFVNGGLPAQTTFFYRVRAFNGAGNSGYTPVASATTQAQVVLAAPCKVPGSQSGEVVFPYENKDTVNVNLPFGTANFFQRVAERGQPQWFPPGKGAFRTALGRQTTDETWTLAGQKATTSATTPACTLATSGVLSTVTVGGATYPVGIDQDAAERAGRRPTETFASNLGPVAAGATAGELSVNHDGAALYTLPIRAPASRAGFRPRDLALVYSSQGGNGVAGVGWNLSGLSQITRCPRHPAYGDPEAGPVEYDEPTQPNVPTYALCLDGKRLIPVNPAVLPMNEYRCEDDPATRVLVTRRDPADGAPLELTVEHGDGDRLTFGGPLEATTTRLEGPIRRYARVHDPSGHSGDVPITVADFTDDITPDHPVAAPPKRYGWLLSKSENRFKQFVVYSYQALTDGLRGVERDISSIDYGSFQIQFRYDDGANLRPDPTDRYVAGLRLLQRLRLAGINVRKLDGTVIADHRLGYRPAAVTGRSLLASFTECDGAGACRPPVRFDWQDVADMTFRPTNEPIVLGENLLRNATSLNVQVADLDRDGRDDLLILQQKDPTKAGTPDNLFWSYALSDGNGYPTVVPLPGLPSGARIAPDDLTCGSFFDKLTSSFPPWFNDKWTIFSELIVTDLNGDGVLELGIRDQGLCGYQFFNVLFDAAGKASVAKFTGVPPFRLLMPYAADLDGDGLPELVS